MTRKPVSSSSQKAKGRVSSGSPNKKPHSKSDKEKTGEVGFADPLEVHIPEPLPVQDPSIWEEALENLDKITREGRTGESEDIERAAETSKYLLGHAVLRFIGPGEIYGVLNTEQDADERYNPRELDEDHVKSLSEIFSRGNIKDRGTPIRVKVPPNSIGETLLKQMQEANPSNLESSIPTLELNRPDPERERQLEKEILYHSDGKKLLSDNEVETRREELKTLRGQRPLARLLNGNHRINAMINAARLLHEQAAAIIKAERNQEEIALDQWLSLNEKISKATYTVEVYRDDTPDYILAWLAENDENRPNYAPRAGEKLWSIVDSQEAMVRHMLSSERATDRRTALNEIMDVTERQQTINNVEDATILAAMHGLKSTAREKGRSDEISQQSIVQLITHPALNAMVVDTSRALWVYNERMVESHIQIMRKDLGAPLVAHYWMSIRLLLKIANVTRGDGLEATEEFLAGVTVKSIPPKGLPEASKHWANLHKNPQRTPALLNRYASEQVALFDDLMRKEMKRANVDIFAKNYADIGYISALRRVFWALGESFSEPSEYSRRFAASLQLYALLPLWEEGCDDNRFFPAALLPNRQYVADYAKRLKSGSDTPGLWVLECLLDEHMLAWTAGAIRTSASQNTKNWHGRARGMHQILLRLMDAERLGGRDAQLQVALNTFDSPAFFPSLSAIDKYLTVGDETRTSRLVHECSARKSSVGSFPILRKVIERSECHFKGNLREAIKQLEEARRSLKEVIFNEDGPLGDILTEHDILTVIPIGWWSSFAVREWVKGWNDPPAKRANTTACMIGWGLVTQEMVSHIVPEVVRKVSAARHLLNVVRTVFEAEGSKPWWLSHEAFQSLPTGGQSESEKEDEEDELEPEAGKSGDKEDQGRGARKEESTMGRNRGTGRQQGVSPKKAATLPSGAPPPPRKGPRPSTRMEVVLPAPKPKAKKASNVPIPPPCVPDPIGELELGTSTVQPQEEGPFVSSFRSGLRQASKSTPASNSRDKPSGTTDIFRLLTSAAPPHIRLGAPELPDTPGNIMAQKEFWQVSGNGEELEAVIRKLENAIRLAPRVLEDINKHRLHLRRSICSLAHQCERPVNEFPFALEYSVAGLVRDVALCRDIFVARVADSFRKVYGCEEDTARAEAVLIAKADGLYDNGFVTLDPATSSVKFDFRCTVAQGFHGEESIQHALVSETSMLPGDQDELDRAVALMDPFMPVHGYGHSLAMVDNRGALGAAMMAGNSILSAHEPPRHYLYSQGPLASLSYVAGAPDQARFFSGMVKEGPGFLDKHLQSSSVKEIESNRAIIAGYESPWSTGNFGAWTDIAARAGAEKRIGPLIDKLEEYWDGAQSADIKGYLQNAHGTNAALPAPPNQAGSKAGDGSNVPGHVSQTDKARPASGKRRHSGEHDSPSLSDDEPTRSKSSSQKFTHSPSKKQKQRH